MFEKKLGGEIHKIEFDADKRLLKAHSTENFSVTYDFDGKRITLNV
jgi:hypothetical protein